MDDPKGNRWIGWIGLVLGVLTLMMFTFEIRDGVLQGSRSYGVTEMASPITFYLSAGLQLIVGLGLTIFGVYSIRRKG